MANVCDYFIMVRGGEPETIRKLKEFLAPAVAHTPGGFYGDYCLHINMCFHDLGNDEHDWIALNRARHHQTGVRIEDNVFCFEPDGGLYVSGASKWAPPGPLVERLSRLFPTLLFEFGGTTEHEFYECWQCTDGVAKRLDAWRDDAREGRRTVYARDGVEYDPPEVEEDNGEEDVVP